MKLPSERCKFTASSTRLRRARRLYKFLCRRVRTAEELAGMAERAKRRGLYAASTPLKDVQFSLLCGAFRLTREHGQTWHQWLMSEGWRSPEYHGSGWWKKVS